jgi:hydrogenase maturation protease
MSPRTAPLVIGVGNPWRGDDAVGPRTIEALARLGDHDRLDADLLTLGGEPARLVAAWQGRALVVVVDAIVTGQPPGTVHVITDLDRLSSETADVSSHGGGIAEAVALGRALEQLPDQLLVVGVEPAAVGHGDGLSPLVAASVDAVVRLVATEVTPCA